MFLPSTGFRCGTFCAKEAGFTRGTMMRAPESSVGSADWANFCKAMIDAYSVPCDPETKARVGPGLAPFTTITAMLVAGSTPAGTGMNPVAFCPACVAAVPTVMSAARPDRPAARISKTAGSGRRTGCIECSFLGGPWAIASLQPTGFIPPFETKLAGFVSVLVLGYNGPPAAIGEEPHEATCSYVRNCYSWLTRDPDCPSLSDQRERVPAGPRIAAHGSHRPAGEAWRSPSCSFFGRRYGG